MTDNFKIISTLGPASLNADFIRACRTAGQPHFRLNGSHLNSAEIAAYAREARRHSGPGSTLCLDLQGYKMRIGHPAQPQTLQEGQTVSFSGEDPAPEDSIPLPHPEIFRRAAGGDILLLQDGLVQLRVESVRDRELRAAVLQGGILRGGGGIRIAGKPPGGEILPPDQAEQIKTAAALSIHNLALSYVSGAADIRRLRDTCQAQDYRPRLIAKIEIAPALQRLTEICRAADEVWFCRGDLGTSVPLRELGRWQDETIGAARRSGTPLIIAGQVFEHLTQHPLPTRSEAVHFSHIRRQGVSGIVLSDETAIGRNPVNALRQVADLL